MVCSLDPDPGIQAKIKTKCIVSTPTYLKAIEVLVLHGDLEDLGVILGGHLEGLEGGAALLVKVADLVHVRQPQHLQQQARQRQRREGEVIFYSYLKKV
jgi:hypothetical protein